MFQTPHWPSVSEIVLLVANLASAPPGAPHHERLRGDGRAVSTVADFLTFVNGEYLSQSPSSSNGDQTKSHLGSNRPEAAAENCLRALGQAARDPVTARTVLALQPGRLSLLGGLMRHPTEEVQLRAAGLVHEITSSGGQECCGAVGADQACVESLQVLAKSNNEQIGRVKFLSRRRNY